MTLFLILIAFIFGSYFGMTAAYSSIKKDIKAFGKFRVNEIVYESKEI